MHEITAEYHSSNMRLCQMPVRLFDGYVRVKKSETIEEENGEIETREFFRRVLSDDTIKIANAFRSEISRTVGQIGFKVQTLGFLVDTRGLEALKELETESKKRAFEIRERMVDELVRHGESDNLARCEVDLIALRLHPDDEFAELVDKLVYEALSEKYDSDSATLTKTLAATLDSLAAGHALVAQKKLSVVGRFLTTLAESQGDSNELAIARTELASAKQIVGLPTESVETKLKQLRNLKLFEGVKISATLQTGAATAGSRS